MECFISEHSNGWAKLTPELVFDFGCIFNIIKTIDYIFVRNDICRSDVCLYVITKS